MRSSAESWIWRRRVTLGELPRSNGNGLVVRCPFVLRRLSLWRRSHRFVSRLAISLAPTLETVLADNTIESWLAPEVEQESQFQIGRVEVAE
jgi:hypothetical protein